MKRGLLPILACTFMLMNCSGNQPSTLGVAKGTLTPCPSSSNCVSTSSTDEKHRIEPLHFTGSATEAWKTLVAVVKAMKRSHIVTQSDTYIHAEFASAFFRFVDDVEFSIDEKAGTIAMRSASRLGSYDFGVNRKRLETIRARFTALNEKKE